MNAIMEVFRRIFCKQDGVEQNEVKQDEVRQIERITEYDEMSAQVAALINLLIKKKIITYHEYWQSKMSTIAEFDQDHSVAEVLGKENE